jgi:hypothetical protein
MIADRDADADAAREQRTVARLRSVLRAPSVIALLVANLVPLYGVAFLGWDLFGLIVVYWLETGIIGFFAILNIALIAGWMALFVVPFFIVHFGGFMAGHLLFLGQLFGSKPGTPFSGSLSFLSEEVARQGLWLAILALFVSHGVAFIVYVLAPFLRRRRQGMRATAPDAEFGPIMFAPYARIVVMHVTIIFGAALILNFGGKIALFVLMVALKTVADLWGLMRRRA